MNKFQKKTKDAEESHSHYIRCVLDFSRILQKTMGLTDSDIEIAYNREVSWEIDKYIIKPEKRAWDNWGIHLEVLPQVGISDEVTKEWLYVSRGTMTIICPPEKTQQEILECIKRELEEK